MDTSLENIIVSINTLKEQVRLLKENNTRHNLDADNQNIQDEHSEESESQQLQRPRESRVAPYMENEQEDNDLDSK